MPFECFNQPIIWITVIISIICLIIASIMMYLSFKELPKLTTLYKPIKYLHYVCCMSAVILMIFIIIHYYIKCYHVGMKYFFETVLLLCYIALIHAVLGIVLLRLHYTFNDSMYQISQCQSLTFIISYTITCLLAIASIILHLAWSIKHSMNPSLPPFWITIYLVTNVSGLSIYITTSIYGMAVFANKLLQLIQSRASSINIFDANLNEESIKLNKYQIKLLNQTSRYVSLLSLAILSTCITLITFAIPVLRESILFAFTSIDCTVNIICLYLQYPFTNKYYHKYCHCLRDFWNCLLSTKPERALQSKYSSVDGGNAKENESTDNDMDNI